MPAISRFLTLSTAVFLAACMPPKALVGENVMVKGYTVQKDGAAFVRAEQAKGWQQRGWDPKAYPKSFDCGVDVAIASFTPVEMAVLDAFAHNPNYHNYSDVQDAIDDRNARVDIQKLTEQQCAGVAGS